MFHYYSSQFHILSHCGLPYAIIITITTKELIKKGGKCLAVISFIIAQYTVMQIKMIYFLYMAFGIAFIILVISILIQQKRLIARRKKLGDKKLVDFLMVYTVLDLMICSIVIIIIVFLLPFLIWTFSPKAPCRVELITENKELSPISNKSPNIYVNQVTNKELTTYVFNLGTVKNPSLKSSGFDMTELSTTKKAEKPRYQKISYYELRAIPKKNIVFDAVNDIYANIYTKKEEGKYIEEKVKLIIPSNSIEKK